jgi:hypothetical protein
LTALAAIAAALETPRLPRAAAMVDQNRCEDFWRALIAYYDKMAGFETMPGSGRQAEASPGTALTNLKSAGPHSL